MTLLHTIYAWAVAHPTELPLALAAMAAVARTLYALLSRLVAPYPRLRALVEALAAGSPDVIRAAQQLASAVLGRPVASLDQRAPDDDREALRAEVERLRLALAALRDGAVVVQSPGTAEQLDAALARQRNGQSGRASIAALLLVAGVSVGLAACPNWQRPACPRAGVHSCVRDQPHYCAPTGELTPIGDEPCSAQGRVCEVLDGGARARCSRPDAAMSDGGVE